MLHLLGQRNLRLSLRLFQSTATQSTNSVSLTDWISRPNMHYLISKPFLTRRSWLWVFSNHNHASFVILLISYKIMINPPHAMLAYFRGFPACFTRHASTCLLHPLWSIPQVSAWQLPCPTRSGFPVRVQPLVSHSDCKHPHKNECTQE